MEKYLVLVLVICGGFCAELPSNFQKCKLNDKFDECLKVAIQDVLPKLSKGIPEINIPQCQPLEIPSMTIGEGTGTVHVVQNLKNVQLFDVILGKVDNVKTNVSPKGFTLDIDLTFDQIKVLSHYDFNGRILVLPIVGNGKSTIIFDNVKAVLSLNADAFEKKGKSYYEIKTTKLSLKPGKITFNFENLFNGDKLLGEQMNNVLNDNWDEIWKDVGTSYEDAIAIIFQNLANIVFKNIPHDQIFLQ